MTGEVKIVTGPDAPFDAEVYINGNRMPGLVALKLEMDVESLPLLSITIEPERIVYEGTRHIMAVEIRNRGRRLIEESADIQDEELE